MATITVLQSDTFESWRVKTNQISQVVGDVSLISNDITSPTLVGSINNINTKVDALAIQTGVSLGMVIALG